MGEGEGVLAGRAAGLDASSRAARLGWQRLHGSDTLMHAAGASIPAPHPLTRLCSVVPEDGSNGVVVRDSVLVETLVAARQALCPPAGCGPNSVGDAGRTLPETRLTLG